MTLSNLLHILGTLATGAFVLRLTALLLSRQASSRTPSVWLSLYALGIFLTLALIALAVIMDNSVIPWPLAGTMLSGLGFIATGTLILIDAQRGSIEHFSRQQRLRLWLIWGQYLILGAVCWAGKLDGLPILLVTLLGTGLGLS